MKKLFLVLFSVALLLGLSQCTKKDNQSYIGYRKTVSTHNEALNRSGNGCLDITTSISVQASPFPGQYQVILHVGWDTANNNGKRYVTTAVGRSSAPAQYFWDEREIRQYQNHAGYNASFTVSSSELPGMQVVTKTYNGSLNGNPCDSTILIVD